MSRKFVPVNEIVRVNISILADISDMERFKDQWWAMDGFAVSVEYADSDGRQRLVSRAEIRQYATQGPFVQEIAVFKMKGKRKEPLVTGKGSY